MSSIKQFLSEDPALEQSYWKIKKYAANLMISGYDITNQCNLRCEGCTYYEGEYSRAEQTDVSLEDWVAFIKKEHARGVTFPHFAGAEAALSQDKLLAATDFWQQGVVYSNGTIRIAEEIPYRIHVGVWSFNEAKDAELRGAPAVKKALRLFGGDKRAIMQLTISHETIDEIREAAKICADNDIKLHFNHYSSTSQYLSKIEEGAEKVLASTFHLSSSDRNLRLDANDLQRIEDQIGHAMDDYPDTVLYSRHFNEWINNPAPRYKLDEVSGLALDCAVLNDSRHRQHGIDLTFAAEKNCCTPNTECRECRQFAPAYSQYLSKKKEHFQSKEGLEKWLDVMDVWCRLHFPNWEELEVG